MKVGDDGLIFSFVYGSLAKHKRIMFLGAD